MIGWVRGLIASIVVIVVSLSGFIPLASASAITIELQSSSTSPSGGQPVTFTVTCSTLPAGDTLIIQNQTLGYEVGPGTVSSTTYSYQDSHSSGTMSYVGEILSSGGIVVESTQVNVSWTGSASTPPQYSYTVACDGSGDGGAILTGYANGSEVGTTSIPLTVGSLQVSGLYAPPIQEMQAENSQTFIPTDAFPVYVRPDGAFTLRLQATAPGHWPLTITDTITLTPPSGAVDPSTNQLLQPLTWNVQASQIDQSGIYVATIGLPKAFPDGSTMSLAVQITDACGGKKLSIPTVATLADSPVWTLTTLAPSP